MNCFLTLSDIFWWYEYMFLCNIIYLSKLWAKGFIVVLVLCEQSKHDWLQKKSVHLWFFHLLLYYVWQIFLMPFILNYCCQAIFWIIKYSTLFEHSNEDAHWTDKVNNKYNDFSRQELLWFTNSKWWFQRNIMLVQSYMMLLPWIWPEIWNNYNI